MYIPRWMKWKKIKTTVFCATEHGVRTRTLATYKCRRCGYEQMQKTKYCKNCDLHIVEAREPIEGVMRNMARREKSSG